MHPAVPDGRTDRQFCRFDGGRGFQRREYPSGSYYGSGIGAGACLADPMRLAGDSAGSGVTP